MTKYAQKKAVADVVLPGVNRATMQMEMFEEETVNSVRNASGSLKKAGTFLSSRAQGFDEDDSHGRNQEAWNAFRFEERLYRVASEDPCANSPSEASKISCYTQALLEYGVNIVDQGEPTQRELAGINIEAFSAEQLAIIYSGVQNTGMNFSRQIYYASDERVTPRQAFRGIFGDIRFAYDEDRNTGLTIATGTDTTNRQNPIYILLDNSSFPSSISDGVNFGPYLPDDFVVTHELGHAFVNRLGNEFELFSSFVSATNSYWNSSANTIRSSRPVGNISNTGTSEQPVYQVPPGYYWAEGFDRLPTVARNVFPNEIGGATPSEGFPDSFAHYLLQPGMLEIWSNSRFEFLDGSMQQWVMELWRENE